jgi:hypothetical protein
VGDEASSFHARERQSIFVHQLDRVGFAMDFVRLYGWSPVCGTGRRASFGVLDWNSALQRERALASC